MSHRFKCLPCIGGDHAHQCLGPVYGCACRCRPMLGLDGPFEHDDPTAPDCMFDPIDRTEQVA